MLNLRNIGFIILLFISRLLTAQEGGPPMLIDDARVADYKEWELNTSFNFSVTDHLELSAPHLDLNYGILPDLQLKIEAPLLVDFRKGGSSKTSVGEISAGVKYQFLKEEKHYVSAATFPQYAFNGDNGFYLPIFVEKTFGRFLFGAALAWFWGEEKAHNRHEYGSLAGYRVTEKFHAMAEFYTLYNHYDFKGANNFINVGFRQEITEHFFILGSIGTQIHAPQNFQKEKFISWIGVKNLF